ncbi:MAG: hypothetical protein M1429_02270 [Patescibacteria group bacterium]|nr:hypothetical protein [Patescibacteria group bacterium]
MPIESGLPDEKSGSDSIDRNEKNDHDSLLSELGFDQNFDFSDRVDTEDATIFYTKLINLGSLKSTGNEMSLRVAELSDRSNPSKGECRFIGLFLNENKNDETNPLGYLTFGFDDKQTATANTFTFARKSAVNLRANLPSDLQESMTKNIDLMSAFEVSADYRGEGLGAILYLLGVAYLEKREIKELKILTGAASMTSLDKGTFYSHYGAEMKNDSRYGAVESMPTDRIHDYKDKIKEILQSGFTNLPTESPDKNQS